MRQIINMEPALWNKKEYSFYMNYLFLNNGILRSPDKASQDSPPTIYLNKKIT